MDDNRGVMLALALLLFWVAGVALFFAFHPGGVKLTDSSTGKESDAQNPVDVLKYVLQKGGIGASTQSADTGTPE